jgi:hypothetical protein
VTISWKLGGVEDKEIVGVILEIVGVILFI